MLYELEINRNYQQLIGVLIACYVGLKKFRDTEFADLNILQVIADESKQAPVSANLEDVKLYKSFQYTCLDELLQSLDELINIFRNQKVNAKNYSRLCENVKMVNQLLDNVFYKNNSISDKFDCIAKTHYIASRWENALAVTFKIIKTLITALFGFVLGLLMGVVVTGGFDSLPAGFLLAFKSAAAYWGSTEVMAGLGPLMFAGFLAARTVTTKTNSPIEKGIETTKKFAVEYNYQKYLMDVNNKLVQLTDEQEKADVKKCLNDTLFRAHLLLMQAKSTWFGRESKIVKAFVLAQAVEQICNHLSNNKLMNIAELLIVPINIPSHPEITTFAKAIDMRRNSRFDFVRSKIKPTYTSNSTQQIFGEAQWQAATKSTKKI